MKRNKRSWVQKLFGNRSPDVAKMNQNSPQLKKVEEAKSALEALKDRSLTNEQRVPLLEQVAYPKRDLLVIPEGMRGTYRAPDGVGVIYVDTSVASLVRT